MLHIKQDLQIPVVVTQDKSGTCDIYVPDLEVTIHGKDYVDAVASAILKCSAIYYYNLERNLKFKFSTTYVQAEKMCKHKNSFATYIGLTE